MPKQEITYHVKMDAHTFRRFAVYNTFVVNRAGRAPALFGGIFLCFALVAFFSGKGQSILLGSILGLIALGMPAVYYFSFANQVKAQGKKLGLDVPRPAYRVTLAKTEVVIENLMKQEDLLHLPWQRVWGAWRVKGAIYLYAARQRAFILPDGQGDESPEAVLGMMRRSLPQGRLHGRKLACTKRVLIGHKIKKR